MQLSADRGILAAQYVRSLIAAKGEMPAAVAFAAGRGRGWDRAAEVLKSVVTAHGATEADDMRRVLGADVRALFRPLSIIGRLQGLRATSFDTRMIDTTAGSTGGWVGAGNPIPVARLNLSDAGTLARLKVGCIVPVSEELARSSDPNANSIITRDLAAALAYAEDRAFANYLSAGVAGEQPAGVAYGSTSHLIGGTNVAAWDAALNACVDTVLDGGSDMTSCAWVMSAKAARLLASLRDGSLAYPGVRIRGVGELMGIPQIASGAVEQVGSPLEHFMLLIDCSQIWFAEDDAIDVAQIRVGAFQLSDSPTNSAADGTATQMVSMFQTHTVGIRAVRTVNWHPTASTACAVLRGFAI